MDPRRPFAGMPGAAPRPARPAVEGALSADEFARRFEAASRVLWTIAAGTLGGPGEAEDVVQEACLLALEKLSTYRRDDHFVAWAGRFVRNAARNHVRKRSRRATYPTAPEELGLLADGHPGRALRGPGEPGEPREPREPGERALRAVDGRGRLAADQDAFDDVLLEALGTLGETQRAALLLRVVHGLSYREVALALEIPEGTAMSHVHRARAALRAELGGGEPADPRPEEAPL